MEVSDVIRHAYSWPATSAIFIVLRYSYYSYISQVAICLEEETL